MTAKQEELSLGGETLLTRLATTLIAACIVFAASIAAFLWCGEGVAAEPKTEEPSLFECHMPSAARAASRFVFFDARGAGHIEPVSNCRIDGVGRFIEVLSQTEPASFRVVYDLPDTAVKVATIGGVALRSGDEVVIPAGVGSSIYDVCFFHVEPPVPAQAAEESESPSVDDQPEEAPAVVYEEQVDYGYPQDFYEETAGVAYDWYAPVSSDPSEWGIVDYRGLGWYCAHSNTSYGQAIAGLQPGDQVTINGRTVTIEGRARNEIGTYIEPLWDQIGREKVLFSTCIEDGSNDVWVIYGE